ncbi:MAG: WhiB family transcriptional regulator [Streptosporangiales bacterium]|nr:WhiB family transcriptional regulator [Streptosporangiales bacterium]
MAPDAPTALCGEVDPELWFPEMGGSTVDSKRLCRECPLQRACLEWALAHSSESRHGVWGGLSERERSALRRRRAASTAAAANELSEVA